MFNLSTDKNEMDNADLEPIVYLCFVELCLLWMGTDGEYHKLGRYIIVQTAEF